MPFIFYFTIYLYWIRIFIFISFADTEVAALWDPEKRSIIGLMTMYDYIYALQLCRQHGIPNTELARKTIHDMIALPVAAFKHSDPTQTLYVDAEDSVFQLCMLLDRSNTDFAYVVNPDDGNIVSILGYLDIINFLHVASKQQPQLFGFTVQQILTQRSASGPAAAEAVTLSAPVSTKLADVLRVMEERGLNSIPIVDDTRRTVLGMYYKSDATFIVRATDPEMVSAYLSNLSMGDFLVMQQQQQQSSHAQAPGSAEASISPRTYSLVKCLPQETLSNVIDLLIMNRVTSVACVNELDMFLGVLTIKDILRFYLHDTPSSPSFVI